jgi:hypothetical protein
MKLFVQKIIFGLFLYVALLIVGNVHAQTAVADKVRDRLASAIQKLQAACGDDLTKYCSTVTKGDGRLVLCMMAHEDKISSKCDYALYTAGHNLDRAVDFVEEAADACWPDIEKHCADVAQGEGHIAQCLVDKKSTLSHECQTVLDRFPAAK